MFLSFDFGDTNQYEYGLMCLDDARRDALFAMSRGTTKETATRDRIRVQKDRRKRRSNRARARAGGKEDESNMYDASEDEEPNFGVKPPELATFHRKTALFAISVGFAVFYGFPKPDVLTSEAWQLLAIFAATICGLVLKRCRLASVWGDDGQFVDENVDV